MGNRKQPFGYCMEMGKIVIRSKETGIVQLIYREYIAGATFNQLVAALRQQEVPYDNGKLWNKNMVARILADRRYLGEQGYPAIITPEDMDAIQRIRESKQTSTQKTAAQKLLRRLSGHTATPYMEQQVLSLLNSVIGRPEKIYLIANETAQDAGDAIQSQLDAVMMVQPIDVEKAKALILQRASAQYDAIGSEEYETQRLRHILGNAKQMTELNAKLLQSSVSFIQVSGNGTVSLRLKNKQILGGETL